MLSECPYCGREADHVHEADGSDPILEAFNRGWAVGERWAKKERDRSWRTINEIEEMLTEHGEAIQAPLSDAVLDILVRLENAQGPTEAGP